MSTRLPLSMAKMTVLLAGALMTGVFPASALADGHSTPCAEANCGPLCPTKTISVPETCWEKRTRTVTKYRDETKTRTVTRYYLTPECKEVPYTYSVCVPKTEMKTETYQDCIPYVKPVEQHYTVQVPEVHQRTVTQYVPVPIVRPCTQQYTVQIPEQRTRTEHYTVAIPIVRQVPQHYTVMVPEHRTRTEQYTVQVPVPYQVPQHYTVQIPEPRTRTVHHTVNQPVMKPINEKFMVQIPEQRYRTEHYTVQIPEVKSHNVDYTVMVPYTKMMTGKRPIMKMVPCKVTREIMEDQGCWKMVPCEAPQSESCGKIDGNIGTDVKDTADIQPINHEVADLGYAYGPEYGSVDGGLAGYPLNPAYYGGDFGGYGSGYGYGAGGPGSVYVPPGVPFDSPLPPGFEYPTTYIRLRYRLFTAHVRDHFPIFGVAGQLAYDYGLYMSDRARAVEGRFFGPGGWLGHRPDPDHDGDGFADCDYGHCCNHLHCLKRHFCRPDYVPYGHCPCPTIGSGMSSCDMGCPSDHTGGFGGSCTTDGHTDCDMDCQPKYKRVWCSKIVKRTVCDTHWKTVTEEEEYTYPVICYRPEKRTRTEFTTHCRPEIRSRQVCYTVMRPEVRTRTRWVTHCVPRVVSRQVCYTIMRPEVRTRMVTMFNMVPQVRSRVVPYTVMRPEVRTHMVNVTTCTYQTRSRLVPYTVCRPETRTRTVYVTNYIKQPHTVTVPYVTHRTEQRAQTVYQTLYRTVTRQRQVPVTTYDTFTRKATRTEVTYKKVPYQSRETYTCPVPYEVEEEICVPVIRMKTVQAPQSRSCDLCPMGPCEPCPVYCDDDDDCFLKRLCRDDDCDDDDDCFLKRLCRDDDCDDDCDDDDCFLKRLFRH